MRRVDSDVHISIYEVHTPGYVFTKSQPNNRNINQRAVLTKNGVRTRFPLRSAESHETGSEFLVIEAFALILGSALSFVIAMFVIRLKAKRQHSSSLSSKP